jgi:hypothetical protein
MCSKIAMYKQSRTLLRQCDRTFSTNEIAGNSLKYVTNTWSMFWSKSRGNPRLKKKEKRKKKKEKRKKKNRGAIQLAYVGS